MAAISFSGHSIAIPTAACRLAPDDPGRAIKQAVGAFTKAELIAKNLACRRGGRWVFAGVSFALNSGQALLLKGANGSGKSSLLRVLASLIAPVEGAIGWRGASIRADLESYRAELRFISHQDAIKPVLRVRENLAFVSGLADPAVTAQAIDSALDGLDLLPLANLPARFLSAGQRRRLALARLLAAPAPLWLLDEPGSGLDRQSLERLHVMISAHRQAGGIVIASSHGDLNLPEAQFLDMSAQREAA
jgi:heme exporter protein A